jgi:hypothetical protein
MGHKWGTAARCQLPWPQPAAALILLFCPVFSPFFVPPAAALAEEAASAAAPKLPGLDVMLDLLGALLHSWHVLRLHCNSVVDRQCSCCGL